MKEQKPETKAESAASFGKNKETASVKKEPYKYVEIVYIYKDGTCRVIEPRYNTPND
jgi:hypothetical protein